MNRTLVAIGCALALAGGSALAQQQQQPQGSSASSSSSSSSPGSLTEKAKETAQTIGDKVKEMTGKGLDKAQQTAESSGTSDPRVEQMQKQADADLKSAKAQCETVQQPAQKSLCDKQAEARHANAEVEIEKAKVAAQGQGQSGSSTSTMGAGQAPK